MSLIGLFYCLSPVDFELLTYPLKPVIWVLQLTKSRLRQLSQGAKQHVTVGILLRADSLSLIVQRVVVVFQPDFRHLFWGNELCKILNIDSTIHH